MSFQVFKTNMSSWMQTPDKLATGNAKSYEDFADKLTKEYDLAVKSGFQTLNLVSVRNGNTELMKSLITTACLTALSVKGGRHTFIDDLGKAVIGYWTGCTLNIGLPPVMPATGAIYNLATVYAFCILPGIWIPVGPTDPINDSNIFLDRLISSMQIHLTTLNFIYFTISVYGIAIPPAPGVLIAPTYFIPPIIPTPPNLIQEVQRDIIEPILDKNDILSDIEVQIIKEKVEAADIFLQKDSSLPEQEQATISSVALEYKSRGTQLIETKQHDSTPADLKENQLTKINEIQPKEFLCESGAKVVAAAKADLGIVEYKNRNYGGFPNFEQKNEAGRIDDMHSPDIDNPKLWRRNGKGAFWCAAAVKAWWSEAGLPIPTYGEPKVKGYNTGPALCNRWLQWAKDNGYFSSTPKQGAAILYRGKRKPGAVHIGIVESLLPGIGVMTIEGNTTGGAKFSDNGGGCYRKIAKWSKGNIIGFVIPPDCL